MKTVALETAASEAYETISNDDIRVMVSMIDYLFTEISRIDPVSASHLQDARATLAESFLPSALPRAH